MRVGRRRKGRRGGIERERKGDGRGRRGKGGEIEGKAGTQRLRQRQAQMDILIIYS